MQKQLTISVDNKIYKFLFSKIGKEKINSFIENLVREKIDNPYDETAYELMANDKTRETEALIWSEETLKDRINETW